MSMSLHFPYPYRCHADGMQEARVVDPSASLIYDPFAPLLSVIASRLLLCHCGHIRSFLLLLKAHTLSFSLPWCPRGYSCFAYLSMHSLFYLPPHPLAGPRKAEYRYPWLGAMLSRGPWTILCSGAVASHLRSECRVLICLIYTSV